MDLESKRGHFVQDGNKGGNFCSRRIECKNFRDFFAQNFRSVGLLSDADCEDRSLHFGEQVRHSSEQQSSATLRLLEEDEEEIMGENAALSL